MCKCLDECSRIMSHSLFTELYFEAKPNFLNPLSFFPFAFSLTGLVKPHPENV